MTHMKRKLSIQSTFFMFSLIFCSLEKKIGSDWFKKCLKEKSGMGRCREYDSMASMAFLKNQEGTASFSPLCSDFNLLVQCVREDFGKENIMKGVLDLKFVADQLKDVDEKILKTSNCFFERTQILRDDLLNDDMTRVDVVKDGYLHKFFNAWNIEQVLKKHSEWVEEESQGLLKTTLEVDTFKKSDRIYASLIYFKDDWLQKFDIKKSEDKEFFLSEDESTNTRRFMKSENWFRYQRFYDIKKGYQVVALPYNESKGKHDFTRYMIYIIPSKVNKDLSKLWDEFYSMIDGQIKEFISKMKCQEIDLLIPAVDELRSYFDLREILKDVFKYNTSKETNSKMVTYLRIDEEGTKAAALMETDSVDGPGKKPPYVIANRPHISFIFDMKSERILFITKDTGIIKK